MRQTTGLRPRRLLRNLTLRASPSEVLYRLSELRSLVGFANTHTFCKKVWPKALRSLRSLSCIFFSVGNFKKLLQTRMLRIHRSPSAKAFASLTRAPRVAKQPFGFRFAQSLLTSLAYDLFVVLWLFEEQQRSFAPRRKNCCAIHCAIYCRVVGSPSENSSLRLHPFGIAALRAALNFPPPSFVGRHKVAQHIVVIQGFASRSSNASHCLVLRTRAPRRGAAQDSLRESLRNLLSYSFEHLRC